MSTKPSGPESLPDSSPHTSLDESVFSWDGNALPRHVWRGLDIDTRASHSKRKWRFSSLTGRVVEISGHRALANLTVAFGLVREAQMEQEPVGWVTLQQSCFYPPDVAEAGIDLGELAVVRLADPTAASRAVVQLVRSGGFGLVVLDFGPPALAAFAGRTDRTEMTRVTTHADKTQHASPNHSKQRYYRGRRHTGRHLLATPMMTQMVGLAQKHDTAVVLLTEKPAQQSSLSSLVSMRVEVCRDSENLTQVHGKVLKDKRQGPGRSFRKSCRAPAGLR